MVSLVSTSKQQSTYGNSRLSMASASVRSESIGPRRSAASGHTFSANSNQSNHISGLSILNSDNHTKPLRIERIDPNTKSLKWASSISDDTENMKMCNNDFITKNKDDVSKSKEVAKGKKVVMTKNERRKNNQNNLEEKLLNLKLKDLENKQNSLQQAIKRERYKLLDQFMNSKANNMTFMQKRQNEDINLDLSNLRLNQKQLTTIGGDSLGDQTERYSKSSRSRNSFSSFHTADLLKYASFINQPPPTPKPNNFSKIDERFIDQKIKYFPSYLRKTKSSMVTADVETALNRVKLMSTMNRQFCTKHKKHRLAQIKADLYNGSKEMFGNTEEPMSIEAQMAKAEEAADAQIAAAAATLAANNDLEDHYSFGTMSPRSRMLDTKTPMSRNTDSKTPF